MSATTDAPRARRALPPLMSLSDAAAERLKRLYQSGQQGKLLRIAVDAKGVRDWPMTMSWTEARGRGTRASPTRG
jgi:iron-sulfur cluster assembly protein